MAPKKNTANPTRSGTGTSKGKAKARQASPDPEEDANPPEPTHFEPPDLSNNDAPPVHAPPSKKESKRAQKACLEREAEDDYAAFEARRHTQQAPASQEEIDRLLALQPPQIENLGPPARGADTLSASHPTLLWSKSSEQFLQVPLQRGTSSGASSRALKCQRSPSPSPCKDNHPSAHHSRGSRHEARPPPGQLRRSSLEMDEEICNLKMELQRFRDYGRQDQETIQYLEKCLAVERQLGYAEGMAQAARDQFCTTSRGCSPVWYHSDDKYARELQCTADESRRSYREEERRSDQTSGASPSYSQTPSSSCHNHHGPTCPTTTTQRARQPELPGPSRPTPAETITVKVKTNMWPEPSSIKPLRLACLPLPSEAVATDMKTMVVCVANAPKKPEDVADYHQLWAGLVNGITIPETFTRIFDVLSRTADIQYYYRMAMGYAEHCRIIAANQGHLQRSAVLAILVNFVVLQ